MTFATLKADAAAFLQRDDLALQIPTFIRYATAQFNRVLRVPQMEARDTPANPITTEFVGLPADFLEVISITRADGRELRYIARPQFNAYASQGARFEPHVFTIEDRQYRFLPAPSAANPIALSILYYERIPDFTTEQSTNWLLQDHPDLYLWGALLFARAFLHDDARLRDVKALYDEQLALVQRTKVHAIGVVSGVPSEVPVGHRAFDILRGW